MITETLSSGGHTRSRAFRALIRMEGVLAIRVPVGLGLGLVVPVILLVILGSFPDMTAPGPGGALSPLGQYVPVLICMVLTLIALVSLPIPLVLNREQGWLRRISTTPVHPGWLLAAQASVNLVLALMATVVLLVGGRLAYGVPLPGDPAGFVLAFILATAALFSLGLLITAVAPSAPVAAVIGTVLLYPLLFLAGLWAPRDTLSPIFRTVGDYTPLAAAAQAMQSAMTGSFPSALSLAVMVAWTLVAGLLAVRFFRWE